MSEQELSDKPELYNCKHCGSTRWDIEECRDGDEYCGNHAFCAKCDKIDFDVPTGSFQIVKD